jgi:hypothetical protein
VGRGYKLDGITISVSKYVGISGKIVRSGKDARVNFSMPEIYERQLDHAEYNMRTVFYDTEDRRAWLLPGDEALLYLSRAYLSSRHSPRRRFSKELSAAFVHRQPGQSAYSVLTNPANTGLDIYPESARNSPTTAVGSIKEDRIRFQHIVSHFFEVLWEAKSWQVHRKTAAFELPALGDCLEWFRVCRPGVHGRPIEAALRSPEMPRLVGCHTRQ